MMAIQMSIRLGLGCFKHCVFALLLMTTCLLGSRTASAADEDSEEQELEDPTAETERPSVNTCVEAHLAAQELRHAGHLLDSRRQLLVCAHEACPGLVRAECTKFLDELRLQIPTIVFRATVGGVARSDVHVSVHGREICSELSTRAREFDPGKYRFKFELANYQPVERDVTIAEGERLVPVSVEFRLERATQPIRRRAVTVPNVAPGERRPVPWTVYAFAGLGAAGLAGFTGLGVSARHRESELRSSCWPSCSEEQIDALKSRALVADASLVIGSVALALAGAFYLFRPGESTQIGALLTPLGVRPQLNMRF